MTNQTFHALWHGFKAKRKTTFRVNLLKSCSEEIEKVLNENSILYHKAVFSDDAFIIENADESIIQNLEIYKDGKIYMQSLSSMLPVLFLEPKPGDNILDMASAPGRKDNSNCFNNK